MATFDITTVKTAIQVLYDPKTTKSQRTDVDEYLQNMRRSDAGWGILFALLNEFFRPDGSLDVSMLSALEFAAIGLHDKTKGDFRDLDHTHMTPFVDALIDLMTKFAHALAHSSLDSKTQSSVTRVLSRLCMCYAAAIVQYQVDGVEIITKVATLFPPPGNALPLLAVLSALPEETHSRTIHLTQKRQVELINGFAQMAEHVFALLSDLMQNAEVASSTTLVERVFRCFGTWCYWVDVKASVVADSMLLDCAFSALQSMPALFEECCDTIRDVIDAYKRPESDMPVISKVLMGLLQLEPQLNDAISKSEDDRVLLFTKLYTAACSRYMNVALLQQGDSAFDDCKMSLLRILTTCALYDDTSVFEECIEFWYRLGNEFRDITNVALRSSLAAQLKPAYSQITVQAVRQIQLPSDFHTFGPEKQEEFKFGFRYTVSDYICSAGYVLGGDVIVAVIVEQISAAMAAFEHAHDGHTGWEACEAAFYAFRAIGRHAEKHNDALQYVFGLLSTVPQMPEMRATCFRLIDRFSSFITQSPELLEGCLDYVVTQGLQSTPTSAGAAIPIASPIQEIAANAFCALASNSLPQTRDAIIARGMQVNIAALHPANAATVIQAVSCAIALLPAGHHEDALINLLQGIVDSLALLATDPGTGIAEAARNGTLLASMVAKDGSVRPVTASALHISEAELSNIASRAIEAGGVVQLDGTSLQLAHLSSLLTADHLDRVAEVFWQSRVEVPRQLALALGMTATERWPLPETHPVTQAFHASDRSLQSALTNIVTLLWPTLSNLAHTYTNSKPVLLKICRVLNFALRSAKKEFVAVLDAVVDVIVGLDAALGGEPEPCYLARILLSSFHTIQAHHARMLEMSKTLIETAAHKVHTFEKPPPAAFTAEPMHMEAVQPSPAAFNAEPMYMESVLQLCATLLNLHADALLQQSSLLDTMLQLAMGSLEATCFHADLANGAMAFLFALLGLGCTKEGSRTTPAEVAAQRLARVQALLSPHIIRLCKTMFRCLVRDWPLRVIVQEDDVSLLEVFHLLLQHYFPPAPDTHVSALAGWGLEVLSEPKITREEIPQPEKEALLLDAFSDASVSLANLKKKLTAIFDACRGYLPDEGGNEDEHEADANGNYEESWT